jgi:hypothetical protein
MPITLPSDQLRHAGSHGVSSLEYQRGVIWITAEKDTCDDDDLSIGGSMLRSAYPAIAGLLSLLRVKICPKTAITFAILAVFFWLTDRKAVAQCEDCGSAALNVLGEHNNGGRGCVACHLPHLGPQSQAGGLSNAGMWGNADSAPGESNPVPAGRPEVPEQSSVLLCVSCHDGFVAPSFGLQGSVARWHVPTLLEDEAIGSGHPLGPNARIEVGNGLQFSNGVFSVIAGSPYAQFAASYGIPSLASGRGSNHYGIDEQGRPYVVCITCHDQHNQNTYVSRRDSPIASDGGGQSYATSSFLNGPYNSYLRNRDSRTTTSNVQFCRQCHFQLSNEVNNVPNIPTIF